jgi:hypothetical protein
MKERRLGGGFWLLILLTGFFKICIMAIYILEVGDEGIGRRLAVSDEGNP